MKAQWLIVGVLVSGSRGLGLTPDQGQFVVFLGQVTLAVPLSTQVYKWVPASLHVMLGGACDGLASHPGASGK